MRSSKSLSLVLFALLTLVAVTAHAAELQNSEIAEAQPAADAVVLNSTEEAGCGAADLSAEALFSVGADGIMQLNLETSWDERCVQNAPCNSDNDCGTGIWQSFCTPMGRCMCY